MLFSRNCSLLLPGIRVLLWGFRCNVLVTFPLGSLPFLPAWGMDPRCCLLARTERCFGKKPCCSFVLFSGAYLRALTFWLMETFKTKCKSLFSSIGCFGCFTKPSLIIVVDEASKGLKIQGRKVKRPSFSEDFWISSAFEMEHSSVQSQRSISLISISNQPLDPSEFVNHGLLLWNQTRQQWLGNKRSEKRAQLRKPTISWNAISDSLRENDMPFPHPIPLPEMMDFLVDVWEQEGLYNRDGGCKKLFQRSRRK